MSDTFFQIYIQVVIVVQNREANIPSVHIEELSKYLTGIITNKGQKALAINGIPNHLHILVGLKPNIALSDLVRDIKCNSTKFINDKRWLRGNFNWQKGFGAFSYSHSQLDRVINYIQNQKKHHKVKTFKEEYLDFLEKFNIKYKNEYLFNFDND